MLNMPVKSREGVLIFDAVTGRPLTFVLRDGNETYFSNNRGDVRYLHTRHMTMQQMQDAMVMLEEAPDAAKNMLAMVIQKEKEDADASC